MKKVLLLVCVISIIVLIASYFIITNGSRIKPEVGYPTYTTNPTEEPLPTEDTRIVIPVVTANPNPTIAVVTPIPPVDKPEDINTSGESGDNTSGEVITNKEFAQDSIIFILDNRILCGLNSGKWTFDTNYKPSDILSSSSYYTYNNKGVKGITTKLYATCSLKYKNFTGVFSENFINLSSKYDNSTHIATFNLPVSVPQDLDYSYNYRDGELKFEDKGFFVTNASYAINFASVYANSYDPLNLTNIVENNYIRKVINLSNNVKAYIGAFIAENEISSDLSYAVPFACTADIDRDNKDETLYFITSYMGNGDEVDTDFVAEYGHYTMLLVEDNNEVNLIYCDYIPAQAEKETIELEKKYDNALYRPIIVDLNDDGIYELIFKLRSSSGNETIIYIYDNGEYIRVK